MHFYSDLTKAVTGQFTKTRHHHAPYHVKNQKFELLLYSNIFVHYKPLFVSAQIGIYLSNLSHFLAVILDVFKETYTLLEF